MKKNLWEKVSFSVEMEPRGKGRPRFTRDGHAYTDAKTRAAELKIRNCAAKAMAGLEPSNEPVSIFVEAHFVPPKSIKKARREEMMLCRLPVTKKPDGDNILKLVCDAMNGITFTDDRLIWMGVVRKTYADHPYLRIIVKVDREAA